VASQRGPCSRCGPWCIWAGGGRGAMGLVVVKACHAALPVACLGVCCAGSMLSFSQPRACASHLCSQEGAERYNLGLLVKEAAKGLCVPGYVHPTQDGNGWMYSTAMVKVRLRHAQGGGCAALACTNAQPCACT